MSNKNWSNQSWTKNEKDNFYRLKPWRSLRKKYIEANPLDELKAQFDLVEAGEIVDHIISRSICPDLELEWDNLQTLSWYSHQQKTAVTRGVTTLKEYVQEMKNGKLQHVCTKEKKEKLLSLLNEKGMI
ncbi:HNH endonuclease [Litoribacter alkaliphilus]|uniref:HNH endonuclease n=1 Tax=Litoribacter ruber TaxID=702568 RepID=A0AAP2CJH8_9BACT|nr:HNH endonuclease [Litoribacter alkaliphilus]MBS9525901.1 HNH endonuclease [Litoribacter alkaliphilus]